MNPRTKRLLIIVLALSTLQSDPATIKLVGSQPVNRSSPLFET
jgi:hypothetical protein